jgi:hypothetical protein
LKRYISGTKDKTGAYNKQAPEIDLGPFKLDDYLFDKQLKFVQDPRPFKVAVCSRRSGKTVACAAHLVDTAINTDEVVCLYITLSRNNAKKIIWNEMRKINRLYKLKGVEDNTELSITFPNRSIIYCSGAKDASEIEKFRGLAIKLCYIDECQSFRSYIEELINDILSPALMDYAGTLCLIGTPGPLPSGFFHDCSVVSDAWAKHGWSFFDNPFIVKKSGFTHQQLLNRELKRRGVALEDPSIQREFFGKWVLDSDSLWIKYNQTVNDYDTLPERIQFEYILGIDLGFNDADALAVIAWSEFSPTTYLVEEVVTPKQGLTELVEQIQLLDKKYKFNKMIIDEGGLGKKLAEEMRRRHGLPVQPADKVRKQENVAFLNDALRSGRFKAKKNSRFAQDSFLVEVDRAKSTPDKVKLSDKYHSDIIDAVLYGFKESPAFTYEPPVIGPKYGTKEWAEAQQDEMWDKELEGYIAEEERLKGGYSD